MAMKNSDILSEACPSKYYLLVIDVVMLLKESDYHQPFT